MRINKAGISSTILRSRAKTREYFPRPQDWNTPTARKSRASRGWARHIPRRNRAP